MSEVKRSKGRPKKSTVSEPVSEPVETKVSEEPKAQKKTSQSTSTPTQTDIQIVEQIVAPENLAVTEHFTLDTEVTINGNKSTFGEIISRDANNVTKVLIKHIRKLEKLLGEQNRRNVDLIVNNKYIFEDLKKKNYMLRELTFNYLIDDHFEEYKKKGTLVKNLQTTLSPITAELLQDITDCYRTSKAKHPNTDMIAYFLSNLRQFYIHLKSDDAYYYIHENNIIKDNQGGYLYKLICESTGETPTQEELEHNPTDDSDSDDSDYDNWEESRPKSKVLDELESNLLEAEKRILAQERRKKLEEEAKIKGSTVEELEQEAEEELEKELDAKFGKKARKAREAKAKKANRNKSDV